MQNDDLEFMSDLQAATQLKPRIASQIFLWVIVGFFVWAFVWTATSEIDERITGSGQVMPSSDMQVVQSLDAGVISEILISEGMQVKKGQILLRIDDIRFASEERGIEAQMIAMKARQGRLKAEASGNPFSIPPEVLMKYPDIAATEKKLFESRQEELEASLSILDSEVEEAEANLAEVEASITKFIRSKELLQKEVNITRRLVNKKAQPEIELIRAERQLNDVAGNLATALQAKISLAARAEGARKKKEEHISSMRSLALGELNEVETKISSMQEALASAGDKVRRADLKSPVDGIIHKLHVKTVGGVIQPASTLIEIVPEDDDLMIRARVSPTDIAFLKPGQPVRVSVTAYDAQIYGTIDGTLERIGADTVDDGQGNMFFEIDVRTKQSYLGTDEHPLPIINGMICEAQVIVGKRTILSYLMKPVLRAKDKAFTEK